MTALSWQPPPVTTCGECRYVFLGGVTGNYCDAPFVFQHPRYVYGRNKDGITESCPMWQQQNKDKK